MIFKYLKQKIKITTNHNTDNKGKLLVTVFAICSCYQDNFITGDKPGPRRCTALNS